MNSYPRKRFVNKRLKAMLFIASMIQIATVSARAQINLTAEPNTEQVDTSEIESRIHAPRRPAYEVLTSHRGTSSLYGASAYDSQTTELIYPEPLNGPAFPQEGDVVLKALTLVIEFPDQPAMLTFDEINNHLNEIGHDVPIEQPELSSLRYNGSIRDYFLSVSSGTIDYQNPIADFNTATGFYLAENDFSYYDNSSLAWDDAAEILIAEALAALEAQKSSGFFDDFLDAEGEIPFLNILISGFAATKEGGLWAHSNWNYGHQLSSGIVISQYQIQPIVNQPEALGMRLFNMASFAHESGHTLFHWYDLYDTDGSSWGLANYALMAYKGYFYNPVPPVAYHRYIQNWETPINLRDYAFGTTLTLESNSYSSYIYTNPDNSSEYYLIEARQRKGQSASITSEGLMILHVDEAVQGNDCEDMTEECHYSVSLEQADGLFDLENKSYKYIQDQTNDLFHASLADQINDTTIPNTNWWDGSASGLFLTNISEVGDIMSFTYTDPGAIIHASVSPSIAQPPVTLPVECYLSKGVSYMFPIGGDFGDSLEIGDFVYLIQDGPEYAVEVIAEYEGTNGFKLDKAYMGSALSSAPCAKYSMGSEDMGDISPLGYSFYAYGDNPRFSAAPDPGYHLENLIIDDESLGRRQLDYIFQNVQEYHTIQAVFGEGEIPIVEITINTTGEGSTNLGGDIRFHEGEDIIVEFLPGENRRVEDVIVDGVSQGVISEYSFTNLNADHTINVSFISDLLGDVDGNGIVQIEDALLIAQYAIGNVHQGFIEDNADVNCDGVITYDDALIVSQYYVGLIGTLSC